MMAGFYSYISILIIIYSVALIGLLLLPYFHEQHHDDRRHARSRGALYRLIYHGDGVFTYERHPDADPVQLNDDLRAMAPAARLAAQSEADRLIASSEGVNPFRARNDLRTAAWEGGTDDIVASNGEPTDLDID